MMTTREKLLAVIDAFVREEPMRVSALSYRLFGRNTKLGEIVDGADLQTATYDKAMAWLSANWPQSAVWPEGVERPALRQAPDEGVAS
jgi:hypothetical protein